MKMVLMMADAARLDRIRRDLGELDAPGYTACPVLEGAGRTGIHAGDRVHPGGLVMIMVAAPDSDAEKLFTELVRRRDEAADRVTRLFILPVERMA
jgi:nitrogen regulatory protein PII